MKELSYCIGVDLGGTRIKSGIFTEKGDCLLKWSMPTNTQNNGEKILSDLWFSIGQKLNQQNIGKDKVKGIGIGIPGAVREDGRVSYCVNIGWKEKDAAGELQKLSGLPVRAANDANTAALGELWKGSGKGLYNFVFITLGTGVGGGVVFRGRVIAGEDGAGGELGHIHVADDIKEICGCGKRGCLEQAAGGRGILSEAKKQLLSGRESSLQNIEDLTVKHIFEESVKGDLLAEEVVDRAVCYLGKAMADVAVVVNPQAFIIGGGISEAGEPLLKRVQESYQRQAMFLCKNTSILLAALGNDAGIYGSAKLILSDI